MTTARGPAQSVQVGAALSASTSPGLRRRRSAAERGAVQVGAGCRGRFGVGPVGASAEVGISGGWQRWQLAEMKACGACRRRRQGCAGRPSVQPCPHPEWAHGGASARQPRAHWQPHLVLPRVPGDLPSGQRAAGEQPSCGGAGAARCPVWSSRRHETPPAESKPVGLSGYPVTCACGKSSACWWLEPANRILAHVLGKQPDRRVSSQPRSICAFLGRAVSSGDRLRRRRRRCGHGPPARRSDWERHRPCGLDRQLLPVPAAPVSGQRDGWWGWRGTAGTSDPHE